MCLGDSNLKSSIFRTFSAPYPAASDIMKMSLLSLLNATNFNPYVQVKVPNGPLIETSWNWVSRASCGIRFTGPPARSSPRRDQRRGTWPRSASWPLSGTSRLFFSFTVLYSHTFAGDYIKAAKGRDMDYYRFQIMTRFDVWRSMPPRSDKQRPVVPEDSRARRCGRARR